MIFGYEKHFFRIPLLTHVAIFDNIYQDNLIFHEGVVSAKVWFVNILIIVETYNLANLK